MSPYSLAGTPGPMMSPPGAAEAMGYIGMNSDYGGMQGVSVFSSGSIFKA